MPSWEIELVVVEETGSTNDLAWEAQARGAPEGFVVFAERQTAGRGQYGRRWESAPHQGLVVFGSAPAPDHVERIAATDFAAGRRGRRDHHRRDRLRRIDQDA